MSCTSECKTNHFEALWLHPLIRQKYLFPVSLDRISVGALVQLTNQLVYHQSMPHLYIGSVLHKSVSSEPQGVTGGRKRLHQSK